MNIEISMVRNGFMLKIKSAPTPGDPLAQSNLHSGEWFARDVIDLLGRIAEAVHHSYEDQTFLP